MSIPWSEAEFGPEEKKAAITVIKSGWLTQGKETESFEKELEKYLGVKHAIVLNSGTSALIASLIASGISTGDEVIVPSFTFIATINSIIAVGAKPVLADCDRQTWNLTPQEAEKYITKKTKAIMPVDIAGMPVDIDGFRKLCRKNTLILIEDAAQAIGAQYKGKKIGSFGHATIFSFHMAKLVTAVEGGCVLTNDKAVFSKVQMIRNHGREELYLPRKHGTEYHFDGFGLNLRMSDVLSSIGRVQLNKIDKFLKHRNKLANYYKKNLSDIFEFQKIPSFVTTHPYMVMQILTPKNKRDFLNHKLFDAGISTRITWMPAHKQKWHRKYFGPLKLKNTEEIAARIIALPIGNRITISQVEKVVQVLKKHL